MTTLEQRDHLESLPWAPAPERPVFVAHDGRRARRLRLVAAAVAVLALLWLAALGAGMLGFGSLPGLTNPLAPLSHKKSETRTPVERGVAPSVRSEDDTSAGALVVAERDARSRAQAVASRSARVRAHRASARRASRPRTIANPAPPPAAQLPQALARQGWARHGRPAPRGQARRTLPQPQPPAPPGQATAPGQAKKAAVTPPPPPPPGNGHGGGSKKA